MCFVVVKKSSILISDVALEECVASFNYFLLEIQGATVKMKNIFGYDVTDKEH